MRIAGMFVALGLLMGLVGCASNRYSMQTTIAAGQAAVFQITGDVPFVTIRNRGPGTIDFAFRPQTFQPRAGTLEVGSIGQSLRGGGQVRVETTGDSASVSVEAQRATGIAMNIESAPAP